jgi:hypothetical protein
VHAEAFEGCRPGGLLQLRHLYETPAHEFLDFTFARKSPFKGPKPLYLLRISVLSGPTTQLAYLRAVERGMASARRAP